MRIEGFTKAQAPLSVQQYFNGDVGPLVQTLAQVPELLQVAMPFIGQQFGASALEMRHKEMIILGVSALQGCRYCTQTHTVVAYTEGLTPKEIAVLSGLEQGQDQNGEGVFQDREAVLWSYIQAIGGAKPDDEHVEVEMGKLKALWADYEIVEITMLIGTTLMLNRYCIALGIPTALEHVEWLNKQDWL